MCNRCIIKSTEHFENGSEIFEEDALCDCPCEEYTDEDDTKCPACNHKLDLIGD